MPICLAGIVARELLRFVHQKERFFSALVRPLVWLFIFAAGFRNVLGVSIMPPYETYVLYEVYVTPGLAVMIQLFNGMQSSLSMVYDREVGSMRVLLTSPFPRWLLLLAKLVGGRRRLAHPGLRVPRRRLLLGGRHSAVGVSRWRCRPSCSSGLMLGAIGLLPVLARAPARELRQRDEFRHLPDVLRLLRALPAVAHPGVERAALPRSASPIPSPTRSSSFGTPSTARSSRLPSRSRSQRPLAFFVARGAGLRSGPRADGAARRPEGGAA